MLEGASTTLTYVCPKTVSVTTVHVTVTKTETLPVVVSTTDVAAPVKG